MRENQLARAVSQRHSDREEIPKSVSWSGEDGSGCSGQWLGLKDLPLPAATASKTTSSLIDLDGNLLIRPRSGYMEGGRLELRPRLQANTLPANTRGAFAHQVLHGDTIADACWQAPA